MQGSIEKLPDPKDVFNALYHHFLCLADPALHAPPGASPLQSGSSGQLTVGTQWISRGPDFAVIRSLLSR